MPGRPPFRRWSGALRPGRAPRPAVPAGATGSVGCPISTRRDGSLLPIARSAAPIDLPNGRGTVLSFQDRTAGCHGPVDAGRDGLFADPRWLAREHHISLRLLQSLFAEDGDSPARCIREQRLLLARRPLLEGTPVGVAVESATSAPSPARSGAGRV